MAAKSEFPRFERGEALRAGLLRVTGGQRTRAVKLVGSSLPPDEVVHGVRLIFKYLRSLLRLSRDSLGLSFVRRENARLRNAALALSPWRDEKVVGDILRKLGGRLPKKSRHLLSEALAQWSAKPGTRNRKKKSLKQALGEAVESLTVFEKNLRRHSSPHASWDGVARGLRRSHRKAMSTLRLAEAGGVDETFHEARKRVKTLFYHVAILECSLPRKTRSMEKPLLHLQALLGKDHDISIAREVILHMAKADGKAHETVLRSLGKCSRNTRKKIHHQARFLFDPSVRKRLRKACKEMRKLDPVSSG